MRNATYRQSDWVRRWAFIGVAALALPVRGQEPVPIGMPPEHAGVRDAPSAGEIDRLRTELNAAQNQLRAVVSHVTYEPRLASPTVDYAEARRQFRTKLLRVGPSIQPAPPLTAPKGVREVEYKSGNLRLKAWVGVPTVPGERFPAVLFLHGGHAVGVGDWTQVKPYLDAGFIVMIPFLRGENGQPGAFSYFYDEVDDVLAAAEHLSTLPYVDANNMFIAGHSVGGTMAMLVAMSSHRFRAAAAFDGAPFWGPLVEGNDVPFDRSDPREIQMRTPMSFAHSFRCPVRLYHSDVDGGYLKEFFGLMARRTVAIAKSNGLDVEAVDIAGDHMSHVSFAMQQSIGFFKRMSSPSPWKGAVQRFEESPRLNVGDGNEIEFTRLRPGKFPMGSPKNEQLRQPDERLHEAVIDEEFCISRHLVTQSQYEAVMGVNPSRWDNPDQMGTSNPEAEHPVHNVSWEDAVEFCALVSLLPSVRDKGWVVDLPSEAEWEYACRAGTSTAFNCGNSLSSLQANINGDSPYGVAPKGPTLWRTTPVGTYKPNAWGIFDMHGNVYQWCKDPYDVEFAPVAAKGRVERVARGGEFHSAAADCRSARRYHFPQDMRKSETINPPPIGFRVVLRVKEQQEGE